MAGRPTDHANLDLTQFNLDVVRGNAGGRIIWQPRILAWYSDKRAAGEPLPRRYRGMSPQDIYRDLHCSDRCYDFYGCYEPHEDPAVSIVKNRLSDTETEEIIETPVGRQRCVYKHHPDNPVRAEMLKWPIESQEEMKVAIWREQRRTWTWRQDIYERECEKYRGIGAPAVFIARVGLQKLFLEDMGVENTIYALVDWPDTVEAYFEALGVNQDRLLKIVADSPIEIINFGDNIHSGTCPPSLFEKHVLPVYQHRCEVLRPSGKFLFAHWDGDCKPLLCYARQTGMDGIEAITPIPQGDVTLEETKDALGDMWLIDGIPAIFFDTTFDEQVLIDCARKCIDLFAPHLILGISDEISSTGDIERVRLVGEIVDDYNASL